jgi:hypothetical protein
VALVDDVNRIADAATRFARDGETVEAVLAVEPSAGERLYLCAYGNEAGGHTWLVLDDRGSPVTSRTRVRDAASIAAICEVAEESIDVPLSAEPRVASRAYLDSFGGGADTVTSALQSALPAVEELARDVEGNYKLELTA